MALLDTLPCVSHLILNICLETLISSSLDLTLLWKALKSCKINLLQKSICLIQWTVFVKLLNVSLFLDPANSNKILLIDRIKKQITALNKDNPFYRTLCYVFRQNSLRV